MSRQPSGPEKDNFHPVGSFPVRSLVSLAAVIALVGGVVRLAGDKKELTNGINQCLTGFMPDTPQAERDKCATKLASLIGREHSSHELPPHDQGLMDDKLKACEARVQTVISDLTNELGEVIPSHSLVLIQDSVRSACLTVQEGRSIECRGLTCWEQQD